ncbi:hypothetical protein [Guptibacillus hwajinpoensis]|uniref:Lipoprotein n=1 Tax=Guptibacillus hwajinpoensis TaxID=208199 RepID=A0A0J6CNZ4_9BACL|nr:hypothetical protein [Alkalihalobacillus macyae]KMM37956.1 hypothetical protein AB986_01065 [Alkalihalobacillus macyae]
MKSFIPLLLIITIILASCSKEPLITKQYTEAKVVNNDSGETLYETNDQNRVEEIINEINTSKRTDTWDAIGSSYMLVLKDGEDTLEVTYYNGKKQNGEVTVKGYHVYTKFGLID